MKTSRRDFFRKAGQLTFLSVLVGGSAYLLGNNRVQLDNCADNEFCRSCSKLSGCSLDKAKKYREDER